MKDKIGLNDFPELTYMLRAYLIGDDYEEDIKDFVAVEYQKSVTVLDELNELLRYESNIIIRYLGDVGNRYFYDPDFEPETFDENIHGAENLATLRTMRDDLIKYIKSSEQ